MTGFQEEKKKAPFKGQGNMKPCGQETNELSEMDAKEVTFIERYPRLPLIISVIALLVSAIRLVLP